MKNRDESAEGTVVPSSHSPDEWEGGLIASDNAHIHAEQFRCALMAVTEGTAPDATRELARVISNGLLSIGPGDAVRVEDRNGAFRYFVNGEERALSH